MGHWSEVVDRFPEERDCLAGYVAWQAAEVVCNAKPANMISILSRDLSCGRNMVDLWARHSSEVLQAGGLCAVELQRRADRVLVMIYRPEALEQVVLDPQVRQVLEGIGYRYASSMEALHALRRRIDGDEFPHEVGFFLGYPQKDVLGFMGLNDLPVSGRGPWRMYGELSSSLSTLRRHRAAREAACSALSITDCPLMLLQHPPQVFPKAA